MSNCVFCKIAKGVIPASVVYSDEKVMAFLDIQPINPGHLLVIPRAHSKGLSELDSKVGGQMFKTAIILAEGLKRSGVKCEGVNLFLADGEAAFQEIFHVHLHVIPRFREDGFRLNFGPNYGIKPEKKEMDTIAAQIKRTVKSDLSTDNS